MGNSMRSFIGNMCGGEESKRAAIEGQDDNRPVPQPAEPTDEPNDTKLTMASTDETFEVRPVENSGSHTPVKKKHRSNSRRRFHGLYEVDAFKPETVNVSEADTLFSKSSVAYQPFAEECLNLRLAMDSFEAVFSHDKKRVEFENAMTAFKELLTASLEQGEEGEAKINKDKLDAGREHHEKVVASGYKVLDCINLARPQIEEDVEAAGKLDVKESAKGTNQGGTQLGLVSKLAIPGKHRRNMKAMKRCEALLTEVADETQEILAIAEKIKPHPTSEVVDKPSSAPADATSDEHASAAVADAGPDPPEKGTTEPSDPIDIAGAQNEAVEVADVPSALATSPDASFRPRGVSCSTDALENEGRLVDYGSFWMLNPSSDEMTLMKRSRSLDSLVSRGSRSVSRYGSYEMVTNMEIHIAEKALLSASPSGK